jgi:hypothetical protein
LCLALLARWRRELNLVLLKFAFELWWRTPKSRILAIFEIICHDLLAQNLAWLAYERSFLSSLQKTYDTECLYTRKILTSCNKSANKLSTSCVRTACPKLSTGLEQAVNNL